MYGARRDGTSQLFLRPLDRFEVTPIAGTEGGYSPFFSPDGTWIGFFTRDLLRKIPIEGGIPITLASVPRGGGGSWGSDGQILVTSAAVGLLRIPADGGEPELVRADFRSRTGASVPHMLPDGDHALFSFGDAGFHSIQLISLPAGEPRALELGNASSAVYVPPGYVVFAQSGGLMAAGFDLDALELTGAPVPVLSNVYTDLLSGVALYDFSQNGTLVYMSARTENRIVWVSRKGQTRSLMDASGSFLLPRLSPDGRRLAVVVLDRSTNRRDVWVLDLERDTFTRLTSSEFESAHEPVWSPDSRSIAFAATRTSGAARNIFVASVDGTGDPLQLTDLEQAVPSSWSSDGKLIFFHQSVESGRNIGVVRVDEPGSEEIVLRDSFQKVEATLSPNGSWLAYMSNESGRNEVYVRPYPSLDRKWQVSSDGGSEPVWAASGRELFYRSWTRMMVVEVAPGEDFTASRPQVLFEGSFAVDTVGNDAVNYAVTEDGESFVMIEEERTSSGWNVVLNWTEELERLVPEGN